MGVKPSSAESGAAVSFPRREADLRGRTVRVTTFPFPPLIFQTEQVGNSFTEFVTRNQQYINN